MLNQKILNYFYNIAYVFIISLLIIFFIKRSSHMVEPLFLGKYSPAFSPLIILAPLFLYTMSLLIYIGLSLYIWIHIGLSWVLFKLTHFKLIYKLKIHLINCLVNRYQIIRRLSFYNQRYHPIRC